MPCDWSLYPDDWEEISDYVKFTRAGGRCEDCGARHGAVGYRDRAGRFWELPPKAQPSVTARVITIVLTTAHYPDPDPQNCAPGNLRALCQRCHNILDAPMRIRHRKYGRRCDGPHQLRLFTRDAPLEVP